MHLKTVRCKRHKKKGPEHNKQKYKFNKYITLGISKQTLMNDIEVIVTQCRIYRTPKGNEKYTPSQEIINRNMSLLDQAPPKQGQYISPLQIKNLTTAGWHQVYLVTVSGNIATNINFRTKT
jgi:hypothetical protein